MRILLTGANGQVGRCIRKQKPEDWEMIAADSAVLDITDAQAVRNMVESFEPDVIINTAGYTNLNAAVSESDKVFAANALGVRNLAEAAAAADIRFIHISSDYVFDGKQGKPYTERDAPRPLSNYAQSKLAGELLALSANPNSVIVRSSWVFSEYGNNFVKTILKQLDQERIDVVTDKIGCPTYAGDLAELMISLACRYDLPRGIYHYCGEGEANRYEFAQLILQEAAKIRPVRARLEPAKAADEDETPRPDYSVLDCAKIRSLGYRQSDWQQALRNIVPRLLAEQSAS